MDQSLSHATILRHLGILLEGIGELAIVARLNTRYANPWPRPPALRRGMWITHALVVIHPLGEALASGDHTAICTEGHRAIHYWRTFESDIRNAHRETLRRHGTREDVPQRWANDYTPISKLCNTVAAIVDASPHDPALALGPDAQLLHQLGELLSAMGQFARLARLNTLYRAESLADPRSALERGLWLTDALHNLPRLGRALQGQNMTAIADAAAGHAQAWTRDTQQIQAAISGTKSNESTEHLLVTAIAVMTAIEATALTYPRGS